MAVQPEQTLVDRLSERATQLVLERIGEALSGWEAELDRLCSGRDLALFAESNEVYGGISDWVYRDIPCDHDWHVVAVACSNGTIQHKRQCYRCFVCEKNALKKADLPRTTIYPRAEIDSKRVSAARITVREKMREALRERVKQAGVEEDARFRRTDEYTTYIKSQAWRAKADLVLKRANNLCEACGIRRATQVHHLNYDSFGDELLWDLRAVCTACHPRADEVRRKQRKKG